MKLKVGDIIEYKTGGLKFEFLDIRESDNYCKVKCINEDNTEWEEEWDDLNNVYNALDILEYRLVSKPSSVVENNILTEPYIPLYNIYQDYCYSGTINNIYGSYKNSGKPRRNAKKHR